MKTKSLLVTTALAMFLAANASGCSKKPPLETFGAAKMAVQEGERDEETARYAPAELQNAQQKLAGAEKAMDAENYVRARRLSEQAIVDAQLAKAKTQATLSRVGAVEQKDAVNDLRREINRTRF